MSFFASDEEDMEMGDDDEPVVGSSDNVDMFGFKMPDNFDLPDDFYSDIRFVVFSFLFIS